MVKRSSSFLVDDDDLSSTACTTKRMRVSKPPLHPNTFSNRALSPALLTFSLPEEVFCLRRVELCGDSVFIYACVDSMLYPQKETYYMAIDEIHEYLNVYLKELLCLLTNKTKRMYSYLTQLHRTVVTIDDARIIFQSFSTSLRDSYKCNYAAAYLLDQTEESHLKHITI